MRTLRVLRSRSNFLASTLRVGASSAHSASSPIEESVLSARSALSLLSAILLGLATAGAGLGLMTTSAYILARAALHPSIAELEIAIVGVRFFGIARGVMRYLERLVSHEATFRLLARLRVRFYRALEPLAPARLLQYRSGDLLARIVADVETLQEFFLRALAPPAVAAGMAVVLAVLVGSFHPWLAVPLLAFWCVGGAGVPLLGRALRRAAAEQLVQARSDLNSALVDGIQGVADLKAFGREQATLEQVQAFGRELGRLQSRLARVAGLQGALAGLSANLAVVAVLATAIWLVERGALEGLWLAVAAMAVIAGFEAVLPLGPALQSLESGGEAARRLREIVGARPAVVDPASARTLPVSGAPAVRVENLRFAYGPGERPALDGVSFDLPPGKKLVIVGPSGAGKSTLAGLLLRFWEPQEGRILVDGYDLSEYAQEEWRSRIAAVAQETHLFNATVRENLLLARPEADEAQMIQAARLAQIHEFVESLPEGYDTWIGEQGVRLSAGQRQRLAIARAYLKDAPILILDEPAANLDALTEREMMRSLRELAAGRTVLFITHRPVGIEKADEILVLQAGHIVERGRHGELLQSGGLYRRMWDLQAEVLGT